MVLVSNSRVTKNKIGISNRSPKPMNTANYCILCPNSTSTRSASSKYRSFLCFNMAASNSKASVFSQSRGPRSLHHYKTSEPCFITFCT